MNGGSRQFDVGAIERAFGIASPHYDSAARLQGEVREELLSRVDALRATPAAVLDLGTGTGAGAAALKSLFPRARVVAADISPAMLEQARRRSRFWRRIECQPADAHALPFADQSFDLVFSNLMLQWTDPLDLALREMNRVLRPGGLLLASSFGAQTLQELRDAWRAADDRIHVNNFVDMHDFGSALHRAGFAEPVLDTDRHVFHYDDVRSLMHAIKRIGAHNVNSRRLKGLTGREALASMTAAYETLRTTRGLPATWQVVYAIAWSSDPSRVNAPVGAETRIDLQTLRSGLARRDRNA
jgi:malonyl-CoA O-methyltransferase